MSWSKSCCCCCCGTSEKNIIRISIFCMIQALIWALSSVFLLAIETCAIKFQNFENFTIHDAPNEIIYIKNLIYTAYLSAGNCYPRFQDEWPIRSTTSERTYNLLFIHGLLHSMWIPVCVLLIVAVRSRLRGFCVGFFLYTPWLLVTLSIIVFDFVAATYYILDEQHAGSLQEFLILIEFKISKMFSKDFILPPNFIWDSYTRYVPLFFILYFTKGVIFIITNIVFFIQILNVTKYISRGRSQHLISNSNNYNNNNNYDDTYISRYKNMDENIPMQTYNSAPSYLQWMEIYQPTENQYEIIITPCKEYTVDNLFPTRSVPESGNTNGGNQSPDYISLINYNGNGNDYQYAYENIWRDIKNENVANVTHIYDYLGRPVAESKVAVKNNNKDVNVRKGSMLTSMDLVQLEKLVNNSHSSTNKTYSTFRKISSGTKLIEEVPSNNNTTNSIPTQSSGIDNPIFNSDTNISENTQPSNKIYCDDINNNTELSETTNDNKDNRNFTENIVAINSHPYTKNNITSSKKLSHHYEVLKKPDRPILKKTSIPVPPCLENKSKKSKSKVKLKIESPSSSSVSIREI